MHNYTMQQENPIGSTANILPPQKEGRGTFRVCSEQMAGAGLLSGHTVMQVQPSLLQLHHGLCDQCRLRPGFGCRERGVLQKAAGF